MVSVIRGEVGLILDANRNSIACSFEDTTKETETTGTLTSPQTTDSITAENSEGSSRANEHQRRNEGKQGLSEHRSSASQTSSQPVRGASVEVSQTNSGGTPETSEGSHRDFISEKSTSNPLSHLDTSPTNFRRPNVSYASAVARSNMTPRSVLSDDKSTVNVANTSNPDKSASNSSSVSQRRKLSKQMTVDDSWPSPIFVGALDEDYFQHIPTSCSSQNVSAFCKKSSEVIRPASVDIVREEVTAPMLVDRSNSTDLPVIATSLISDHTDTEPTKSILEPILANVPDDKEMFVPVASAAEESLPTCNPVQLEPISVNLPDADECDDLRPVREVLPERAPGAAAVVRVENHPYNGAIPSRTRQLVRSMAMCGDDDTRLRPPPPPMLKTYASVAAIGIAPRPHRNSSSLSRESSYTDYTVDLTEMEIRAFITATLHKNPRDRSMILELEQLFIDFLNNFGEQSMKLPPVSSYNRMIIHRLAVLFGLDHNVDNSGKCVVVSKTSKTKQPSFLFASLIQSNIYTDTRRYYNGVWHYGESSNAERRAQSFDTGYLVHNAEYEPVYQPYSWIQGNQRSFDKQPHFYPMAYVDQGGMPKKACSFSDAPAFCRSASGSVDSYDRPQNPVNTHSLASSSHLSPREQIDETAERINNLSFSDRASQISYRSTGSNPPPLPGVYVGYPPVVQYQIGDDMTYTPYQQQIYVQQSPVMASPSVEMYTPQPTTIMMPVQQNAPLQPGVPMVPCQQAQDQLSNTSQTLQDHSATQMMPMQQPGFVQYPAQQYSTQVVGCPSQTYHPVPQTVYSAQCQQILYPQQYEQLVRQPMMQQSQPTMAQPAHHHMQSPQPPLIPTQQYSTTIYHTSVQPHQYQSPIVQPQMPQTPQNMLTQPVVQIQSPMYQQTPRSAMMSTVPQPQQQYMEVPNIGQHSLPPYQQVSYGQWSTGVQYKEEINENEENNDVSEPSEVQTAIPPVNMVNARMSYGKPMMNPLSVLVQPEPMYHYSQTSPVMSSMQQQQMMQFQCHSRPLLYKTTQQYSNPQNSIDAGYCSMTQDSIRDGELAGGDAQ